VKKSYLILLLVPALLFSGCAMTVPLNPALLMLLKNDAPAPTLELAPKTNEPTPAYTTPAEIARESAAAMG
jgi:hypothetical protein